MDDMKYNNGNIMLARIQTLNYICWKLKNLVRTMSPYIAKN